MDLSELYSQRILEIAANQPVPGRLADADATARKTSRICGSSIEVDLKVSDGVIVGYGHEISACALGQTSAAILASNIVGTPVAEFTGVRADFAAMLKANGPPPGGKWQDLRFLEPVRDYPNRHASTLLAFEAVAEALGKLSARQVT